MRKKAEGYGMKNEEVDGMDVMAVREKALKMYEEIRNGSGPQFLEVHTYRFRGHSMGDPERYRKAEEVHFWQENDPIGVFRKYMITNGVVTVEELDQQDIVAEKEVQEAVEFAEASPDPAPEELFKDIYVEA